MSRQGCILKIREKIAKLSFYHLEASKRWGENIAGEMFSSDLDYLTSLLLYINTDEKGN